MTSRPESGAAGAVLPAAGRGTRLRPLTDSLPKPALPLLDVPVGACGLDAFRRAGLRPLINVSHLPDEVERALSPYAPDARWLREPVEPFGTAGTLREARAAGLLDEDFVVWNADVVADVDLVELLEEHRRAGAAATVVVQMVDAGADFDIDDGQVRRFVDRRRERSAAGGRFAGIAVLSREVVDLVPDEGTAGIGESILSGLATRGDLSMVEARSPVVDVGTVSELVATSAALAGGTIRRRVPSPGRVVDVPGGFAYVGPGAAAAPGTLRPGAVLLAGAQVEDDASVERAVVWAGERVPPQTTLKGCLWFRGAPLRSTLRTR